MLVPPIRILVVDDSLVIRKVVSDTLKKDPAFDVVGTAGDGRIALAKISLLHPDVVILDISMPVMGGLDALAILRKEFPGVKVIMFSTLTARGAAETIEALSLGAADYATKPTDRGSLALTLAAVEEELVPKIKALGGAAQRVSPSAPQSTIRPRPLPPGAHQQRIDIVAIGTSTGGPSALAEVVPRLPAGFPVPVVIVQHMPASFTGLLAERLSRHSPMPVHEGTDGKVLVPGQAWIAPGNFHMTVVAPVMAASGPGWRISLNQGAPEHSCRPAVDVLFRSVAATGGAHVLGVVMTGMGMDGAIGARHIREAGGQVIVQDEPSSVVWGMPGAVYAAGQADGIYSLARLASEIIRRVQLHRVTPISTTNSINPSTTKLEVSLK